MQENGKEKQGRQNGGGKGSRSEDARRKGSSQEAPSRPKDNEDLGCG